MEWVFFQKLRACGAAAGLIALLAGTAQGDPRHGIAMYGDPALPPDLVSLPYANPDAPKGGRMVWGETGGFDSLNPFILKGTVPWQMRLLGYESLMARNWDEPFTLYGLLAESVETGPNREWVEFTLREAAHFSDGSPVTVEDVLWSYEILGTRGHPRYRSFWQQVARAEATGPRSVRFTFVPGVNRELALIAGLRPILKKAQFEGKDFARSTLDDVPIGSAAYVLADMEPGRFVSLRRDPGYWGRDLPINRGTANLDELRIEFYGDASVVFEAFKAGLMNMHREPNAEAWATRYDFPLVQSGAVVKSEIPHQRPSGMLGFVMNSRDPLFADWRVRQAMILAYNFEYMNDTVTGGRQPRITSYFSNSELAMRPGPATGRVAELLEPYADELLPGTLEGYELPVSDGSQRNRRNMRRAVKLLAEAGWQVRDGVLVNAAGRRFAFDILLRQGDGEYGAFADIYVQSLARLGIEARVVAIDNAQYVERTNAKDFAMTPYQIGLSLSPGNEQRYYFASDLADQPGSRNWMGVKSPAVDGLIDTILGTTSREELLAAVRALDRVLTAGRYVIPSYQWNISRIAHAADLRYPDRLPAYGDWGTAFLPTVWWMAP